jgi:CBS domain-containing protein
VVSRTRPNPIRAVRRQRQERLLATRAVRDTLISVAGLVKGPVLNQAGAEIGPLVDVVARWDGEEPYPPVIGLVVKIGTRVAFVSMNQVAEVSRERVRLRSARLDLTDFVRRPEEVMLARDIVDHQLVDVDGVQVIRAADLYLAWVPAPGGSTGGPDPYRVLCLVGVDVSAQTLLRRLGPKRFRGRPTPDRVIDWAAIQPFGGETPNVRLRIPNEGLKRLRPSELADLLEDLNRTGRQELLAQLEPETAADALEEMDAEELGALLRETPPDQAAELLANMEPDEAVDALRDLEEGERAELLEHMPADERQELTELLEYKKNTAGGFMTSNLVLAQPDETVEAVRQRLRDERDHAGDIDAVVIVDDAGIYLDDVGLFDLATAAPEQTMRAFMGEHNAMTVRVTAEVDDVATELIESRRNSIVVTDDDGHPVGRILADDVLDHVLPEHRFHFPRLLS